MRSADSLDLLYFSYVTLATLGYGDVVPITDGARSLAVLEALGGTVYLAILVARLIGLHLAHSGTPR
jgi:voltage-gated potassium channel Kch